MSASRLTGLLYIHKRNNVNTSTKVYSISNLHIDKNRNNAIIYLMTDYEVSTPIDSFEHPETGSVIDVISLVHIGLPAYYRKLGGYIMTRQDEGFIVHGEGITEEGASTVTSSPLGYIRRRLMEAHLDQSAENYALVEVHSGYTLQDNSKLFREKDSENHDVSVAYITRHVGFLGHLKSVINAKRLTHKLEKNARKGPDHVDEFVFKAIKKEVAKATSPKKRHTPYSKVMLNARNQVALEGVDGALAGDPSAKLVLVWGIGHFTGLQSGLTERGYQHTNRQEVQAAFSGPTLQRSMRKTQDELQKLQTKINTQKSQLRRKLYEK